jgi:uncharacterized protein (TIGR02246 family)
MKARCVRASGSRLAGRREWMAAVAIVAVAGGVGLQAATPPAGVADEVRRAAESYAKAYNARDYKALADQWIERAELVEGSGRLSGRDAIMSSLRHWREAHPDAALKIDVTSVEPLTAALARVNGRMTFTSGAGATPVTSQFTSLRVLDDGAWRLAESVVVRGHAAALDDLGWLVGSWRTEATGAGTTGGAKGTISFEKQLGGHMLLSRGRFESTGGPTVDSLQMLVADRASGTVRCWLFDSTGARAEGVLESDGTTLHQSLVGTPAESAAGSVASWVQLMVPAGTDRFTMHAVERTLDGVQVPDGEPVHFQRIK